MARREPDGSSTTHQSRLDSFELRTKQAPHEVPCAVLVPPGYDAGEQCPLCLFLHGGGSGREMLDGCRALFDAWWAAAALPPMLIATASTGAFSYYFDAGDGSAQWETFVSEDFLAHLRRLYGVRADRASTCITGISMGGYGSLKIAFRHPERFAAVAAVQPLLQPGLRGADAGARNSIHYLAGGPPELIGDRRDAATMEANNPANRARANAAAIRESGLAIYLEVGDDDALNAHDGTEFLHRVLWDLDIGHEYHLVRGADHVGSTLPTRLAEAFAWLGNALRSATQSGSEQPDAAVVALRAQLAPAREQAALQDSTVQRHFGLLPPIDL